MLELHTSIQYVKGVGSRVAAVLGEKGIATVEDLLYYLPFRYEDRANPQSIADLRPGQMASVIGEVRGSALYRTRNGMPIFELIVAQGRTAIACTWFHGAYLKDRFKPGQVLALYGKVEAGFGRSRGRLQLMQPQIEVLGTDPEEIADVDLLESKIEESPEFGRIVPVYEAAGKLNSRWFRRTIHRALQELAPELPDGIPASIQQRLGLAPRRQAFVEAHFPVVGESIADLESRNTPAHRRLIFEELFFLEVGLELKRRNLRRRTGTSFQLTDSVRAAIKKLLPFHPTAAQKRVLAEIAADMQSPAPMRRLLQGDVGSGKTIVALEAAVIAIENGYQAALMAPTEILATQHYLSARKLLEDHGYRVALLTGSLEESRKRDTRRHLARGDAHLVVGTHALIEEKVEFSKLGLIVVDEQHRFGVMQRWRLMRKPSDETAEPDVLVMTATPIPRTLALTLYGDLDVSILDELPPGRTPIVTRCVSDERAAEVWQFLRKQVAQGRQAYVVYPVIEGSEAPHEFQPEGTKIKGAGLKAATAMYDELRKKVFPDLRVGLLHGRLSADEKEIIMGRFKRGEIDVLVATTVIEVGVDVPNATMMVVEHAERFGLSQLHQLRGRIGRGSARSYCVLMTAGKITEEGQRRLDAMVGTQDGFAIAELDLELRGPGEFFGTRQAGAPSFRVANLIRDRKLLELARAEAQQIVNSDKPPITNMERTTVMSHLKTHWQRRYGLVEVG
ncbi:MAG TPA: ATP-dependent DNA helicase RecG [Terriglobales bacterium]|nr:ATP-dependent DNA helicase RecG [Terriglobales bacterium]